ncbi:MAG: ferredoxin--NADP reductase [Myxococcota bacterium]
MASPTLNATIVRRDEVGPDLLVVGVRPDGPAFDFLPGQYATLGLPGTHARASNAKADRDPEVAATEKLIKRAYSIASPSTQRDSVEFYLNMVDDGAFTPRLFALPIGGRVWMSTKAVGTFTLEGVTPADDVLLIATGTGLAPFMSMLESQSETRQGRHWVLVHGTRYVADLGYHDRLLKLAASRPWLSYLPSVTRPETAWSGRTGRVQGLFEGGEIEAMTQRQVTPQTAHVYLCGNPDMITSMQAMLESRGFKVHKRHDPGQLHIESYW